MTKKILASILCFVISFSVLCSPCETSADTEVVETIFSENFDSGIIDEKKLVFSYSNENPSVNTNPDVRIEDGKLKFQRYDNSGCMAIMRYYFNDEQAPLTNGLYCIEYDLHKNNHRNVWLRLKNGNYEYARDMYSYTNNFLGKELLWNNTYHIKYFVDTQKSVYYVWVDGELLASAKTSYNAMQKGVDSIQLSLEGGDAGKCTVSIDNLIVYKTTYSDKMLLETDAKNMTISSLLTGSANILGETYVTNDLNLYTQTPNGCTVRWSSSAPEVINPETGKVTRYAEDKTVILNATVSKGNETLQKSFEFTVLAHTGDYLTASKDIESITYETFTNQNPDEITTSLNFAATGAYGSDISYTSDSPETLSESGRVTRPFACEDDKKVNLTATAKYGESTVSKDFVFTVKAEDALRDPMDMSDEDFFGVYDKASQTWTNKGVFDYSSKNELADMSLVKSAVMDGNYTKAKEELLTYMRTRKPGYVKTKSRNTIMANAATADFASKASVLGETYVGGNWEKVETTIPTSALSIETPLSLDLVAFYNEASMAEIKTKESGKPPILRLTVNGTTVDFEPTDDGYIRLGDYSDKNYGKEEKMYVKLYGADLGDETYRSKIKFDISSLETLSGVTSAKLLFEGKSSLVNNEKKRILIVKSYSSLWEEETLCYKSHIYDYRSFNGQPNGIDWVTFNNADVEYMYQICRFPWLEAMACEYENTNDDIYAYRAIRQLMDFICDHGGDGNFTGEGPIGQYPRSLDTTERLSKILASLDALSKSVHMTSDSLTAIMKHIYHMAEASRLNHSQSGNWAQTIMQGLLQVSTAFPEFAAAKGTDGSEISWTYYAHNFNIRLMENSYLEDGTYIEPTGGYSVGAHRSYIGTYGAMKNEGYTISDEAYNKLYNGTYYNLLSFAPGGMTYAYGDSGYSAGNGARQYQAADEIFNDPELKYIDSYGATGTKPSWTSKSFPVGKYTFMRSDWSKNALYMATEVRGYESGNHGHADRNQVVVAAYGKLLLTDAGSFTYTSGALRELGRSTKMHNTVSINNETQIPNEDATPEAIEKYGKIHQWQTNQGYDFLVQSTNATPGFDHKRTIFFAKPYYWIVSDYIDAEDDSKENEYHQNWHMMPTAKMTVDNENKVMYSNNADNINIVVASADSDADAVYEKEGYWAQSIGSVTDNPYGYFSKTATGDATFDTALIPTKSADSKVSIQRLQPESDEKNFLAMKITTSEGQTQTNGYYYLSHEYAPYKTRSFGAYSTDGQMAFVHEDGDASFDMIAMQNASFVKKDGKPILESDEVLADISVKISGMKMHISSSENLSLSSLKIYTESSIKSVYINDEKVRFTQVGEYVTSTGLPDESSGIIGDIFEPTQIIYAPDFVELSKDPTDGGRITATRNAPESDSDGSLKLTSSTQGQSVWQFYFNQNKSNLPNGEGNIYCIDFDIKKPATQTAAYIQIGDSGDKMYRAYINDNSLISPNEFTNIKFIVDTSSSSKKLLYVVDNQYATITDVGRNLQNFLLCTNASSYSYYIDNFAVYKISKKDFDGALEYFSLTEDKILGENLSKDEITKDLKLSDSLEWISSDENLITNDGKYLGNTVWQSENVTITAKLGNLLSRDITLNVMRKTIPGEDDMSGDYHVYDDFETSTLKKSGALLVSGTAEIKDGKLYHTHTGTSGETVLNYYFTPQKSPESALAGTDITVVEFDVKKELDEKVSQSAYYIRIQSYDGWRYFAQTNVKADSVQILGTSQKTYDDTSTLHFKYILDPASQTYSLYINGVLEIYENQKNKTENPYNYIQGLTLVNQTPGASISLDNIKVYNLNNKDYNRGYMSYGFTQNGVVKEKIDSSGVYEANISYFANGQAMAPDEQSLPVCYVVKYSGDSLKSVDTFKAKLVTYSVDDGAYGWWYPGASADIEDAQIGSLSVKAFVWDGVKPLGEHIGATMAVE